MSKFKKSLLVFSLGIALIPLSFAKGYSTNLVKDTVVATYDNHIVLLSDIQKFLPKGSNVNNPTASQIEKATESFVINQLKQNWLTKAKQNIHISEDDIENTIYSEAAANGLTYDDFVRALAYQGISIYTLKKNIKEGLEAKALNEFLSENVKTQLDKKAIEFQGYKNYQIAKAKGTLAKIPTYDVSYILIKTDPLVSNNQAKAKIIDISKDIKANKISFENAAYKYSDDLISAAKNGKLGLINKLPAAEEEAISKAIQSTYRGAPFTKPINIPGQGWAIIRKDGEPLVEADLSYYINQEYQKVIAEKYSKNTLETFLLNSVIIHYTDDNN